MANQITYMIIQQDVLPDKSLLEKERRRLWLAGTMSKPGGERSCNARLTPILE
jgi:hypothetical protein